MSNRIINDFNKFKRERLFMIKTIEELDDYVKVGWDINAVNYSKNSFIGYNMFKGNYNLVLQSVRKYDFDLSIKGQYERTVFFSSYLPKKFFETERNLMLEIIDEFIRIDKDGVVIRLCDEDGLSPLKHVKNFLKKYYYKLKMTYNLEDKEYVMQLYNYYVTLYEKYHNHILKTSTLFELMIQETKETNINKKRRFH